MKPFTPAPPAHSRPPARPLVLGLAAFLLSLQAPLHAAQLIGRVIDASTQSPLPARLYLQNLEGRHFFAESAHPDGTAVVYDKQNWVNQNAVERHTTLSAHPFRASLPPGRYILTAERGKEYHPATLPFTVSDQPLDLTVPLARWIDMKDLGWFSGDTHVHRPLTELPNVLMAEDLNVALPLVYWVTRGYEPPAQGNKNVTEPVPNSLVRVDPTHVFYPRNTEYEIFTLKGQNHTLGAVFLLNHQTVFDLGAPPVGPVAQRAHREGALLDLDKHDWPWSMALIPLMDIDLFELSNNHVWRTQFAFTNWNAPAAPYMNLPLHTPFGPERDWIEFGFQNYYTLLNCGFHLRPTAGTASGVHPVPLGFSRVYVHMDGEFTYDKWIHGLDQGRSFVTTGPMLLGRLNGQLPGQTLRTLPSDLERPFLLDIHTLSQSPLDSIEIIVNGRTTLRPKPLNEKTAQESYETRLQINLALSGSSWVALRCFEPRPDHRFRFAHSGPFHVQVPDLPLRPARAEVQYLMERVQSQIDRSRAILPPAALAEYEKALAAYRALLPRARP